MAITLPVSPSIFVTTLAPPSFDLSVGALVDASYSDSEKIRAHDTTDLILRFDLIWSDLMFYETSASSQESWQKGWIDGQTAQSDELNEQRKNNEHLCLLINRLTGRSEAFFSLCNEFAAQFRILFLQWGSINSACASYRSSSWRYKLWCIDPTGIF